MKKQKVKKNRQKRVKKVVKKHVKRRVKAGLKRVKKTTKKEKKRELNLQVLEELIERGRPRGFVTDTEVLHYFPNIEDNVAFLEEVYDNLEKANIKVVETTQLIELPKDDISSKELEDAAMFEQE